jgi:hypothetical protein
MYRTLLTDPETFYDEYVGTRGLRVEILLVLVIGAIGLAGNVYALLRVEELFAQIEVPLGQDVAFAMWGEVAAPLVGAVVLWVGLTTALYVVSWLYSAVGEYYVLLKRTAWALVPLAFANLIHSVAMAYAGFSLSAADVAASEVPRVPERRAAFAWEVAAGELAVVAAVVVGLVFAVLTGYVAAYAVRGVRDIETDEAYRVAAVPTVAYVVYVVYEVGTTAL